MLNRFVKYLMLSLALACALLMITNPGCATDIPASELKNDDQFAWSLARKTVKIYPWASSSAFATGFAIGSNHVMTAAHVVEYSQDGIVEIEVWRGPTVKAEVIYYNRELDAAVLKVTNYVFKEWFNFASEPMDVGDNVHVMGHPQGKEYRYYKGTVTIKRVLDGTYVFSKVDIIIAPGMSGSALINELGEVVGVLHGGYFDKGKAYSREALFVPIEVILADLYTKIR